MTREKKHSARIFAFTSKAAFMQRILRCVRNGHLVYIKGVSSIGTIFQTYEKLSIENNVHHSWLSSMKALSSGNPTGQFFLYQNPISPNQIFWFLFVQGRSEQLSSEQNWIHLSENNFKLDFDGCELVRDSGGTLKKPNWHWRMGDEKFLSMKDSLTQVIHSKDAVGLESLLTQIFSESGFCGSESQENDFLKTIKNEWLLWRVSEVKPKIPKKLGDIFKSTDHGVYIQKPNAFHSKTHTLQEW